MRRYPQTRSFCSSLFSAWTIVVLTLILAADLRSEEILHAAYWENTEETVSEIGLHNNKAWEIAAKLRLLSPEGIVLGEKHLVLPATSMLVIELESILPTLLAGGLYGRAEIAYEGKVKDVIGQVIVRDRKRGTVANADLYTLAPFANRQYEVLAPPASQYQRRTLSVSNTSLVAMQVSTQIYCGQTLRTRSAEWTIGPGKMRVVDLSEFLAGNDGSCSASNPMRIVLKHDAAPGSMGVTMLNRIRSGPLFFSRVVNARQLRGTSVILPYFETGTGWNGIATIANRTAQQQTISVDNLSENGDAAGYREIGSMRLKPYEVIHAPAQRFLRGLAESNGPVALRFRAQDPADAISESPFLIDMIQRNRSQGVLLQAAPKNPETERSAGFSQPWQVGGGAETIIALVNPSLTDEVPWMATVHVGEKKLSSMSEQPLKPLQVKYLRLSEMISGVPDSPVQVDHHSDSVPVLSGFIQISVQPSVGQRRFLLSQAIMIDGKHGVGMVSSCSSCPPSAYDYSVSPLTFSGVVGQTFSISPLCHLDNGTQQTIFNPFALSWSPSNSSVASVSSTWTSNILSLLGPGTTTIGSQANDCVYEYDHFYDECNCVGTPFDVSQEVQTEVTCSFSLVDNPENRRIDANHGDVRFKISNLNCPVGEQVTVALGPQSSTISVTSYTPGSVVAVPLPGHGQTTDWQVINYSLTGSGTIYFQVSVTECQNASCATKKWIINPASKNTNTISFP